MISQFNAAINCTEGMHQLPCADHVWQYVIVAQQICNEPMTLW